MNVKYNIDLRDTNKEETKCTITKVFQHQQLGGISELSIINLNLSIFS